MKKKLLFLTGFVCFAANAQNDSIKKNAQAAITDKFPATRMFDLQYQQYLPTDFDSELLGDDYQKGEITNHYKVRAAANVTLYAKPRWNITGSFVYRYEAFELDKVETLSAVPAPFRYREKPEFHYLSGAVSFTYFSSLWKKPFIYNASLIVDGTEKHAERVKGLFGATLILKKTERTTIGVGALAFIDPTSNLPVVPVFLLDHQFKNSAWSLDMIVPQRLLFKRPVFENGRISLGSEFSGDGFYMYADNPDYADVYEYRQLEIRSGLTYEHKITPALIATFKGGIANIFNVRVAERGESANDEIMEANQDGTGYFNIGLSYNPQPKKDKKKN